MNNGENILLLHGWGFGRAVWRSVARELPATAELIDLPGYGPLKAVSPPASLASMIAAPSQRTHGPAVWVGWSLGGMAALTLAAARPELFKALVLVGVNGRFTVAVDWPHAVAAKQFQNFCAAVDHDPRGALLRFARLVARAPASARATTRTLLDCLNAAPLPSLDTLRAGLRVLAEADLRGALTQVRCPVLLVLGDHDALVPVSAAAAVRSLNPAISFAII